VVNQGKDQLKAFGAAFIAAMPDLRRELTESFATDDRAGMEWLLSGMRRGDLASPPRTSRSRCAGAPSASSVAAGSSAVPITGTLRHSSSKSASKLNRLF
jgi:hypothetical protein